MKIADMTIGDVLQTPEFYKQMDAVVADLKRTRKMAGYGAKLKAHPIDKLIAQGKFETGKLTVIYAEIRNKVATGYSSAERRFIENIGNEAFNNTMQVLIKNEKDNETKGENSNGEDKQ